MTACAEVIGVRLALPELPCDTASVFRGWTSGRADVDDPGELFIVGPLPKNANSMSTFRLVAIAQALYKTWNSELSWGPKSIGTVAN